MDDTVWVALMATGGTFWQIAYILIIYRAYRDKTYGMPIVALCANLSWEFMFTFIYPPEKTIQLAINALWFFLDVVIFAQLVRFGRREFPNLSKGLFYGMLGLGLVTASTAILAVSHEFNDWTGVYAAFCQDLMMSILFISFAWRRQSLRGQSPWIAACKLLGSLSYSISCNTFGIAGQTGSVLLRFTFVAILAFNLIYLIMMLKPEWWIHQESTT